MAMRLHTGYTGFGGWGGYGGYGGYGGWGGGYGAYGYCPPSYYRAGTFNNNNSPGVDAGAYTRYRQALSQQPGNAGQQPWQ
ncbi:MAG: hypothetical protein R3B47_18990 [Bacteroidia bacterium]